MGTSRSRQAGAAILAVGLAFVAGHSAPGTASADTRAPTPEDRYAMAGGCYSIRSLATGTTIGRENGTFALSGSAEPFHFQATDLGRYLMFGSQSDFLAAEEGAAGAIAYAVTRSTPGAIAGGASVGATDAAADMVARSEAGAATGRGATVVAARDPSELADWEIDRSSADAFTIRLPATGQSLVAENGALSLVPGQDAAGRALFGFALTTGCAEFPEIEVNVTGEAPVAGSAADAVRGYLDAHVHMMAFEFIGGRVRCGRPWHAYGVARALVDCPDHGPHGETAALEMVLSGGDPVNGHSPEGWPSFAGWPKNGSLTHEQIYYRWLERAWRGGLRMMTNLLVDNHALCAVYPFRRNSCNEMDGVRLQAQRIRELERYIDAQSGGPGEGWFRIVTDPFQARDVMNAGKLAVVLGIEVSTPLDCGILHGVPMCSEEKIDQQLDAVYALGVRQMELANKFDNALTGVTGDEGGNGVVVNSGNRAETGQFWPMGTCADPALGEDKLQYNAPDQLTGRDSIFGGVLEVAGTSGVAPVYPQGPHCNAIGLTALGAYAVQGLIDRGIIFDPDHMSAHARHQALDILQDILQEGGHAGVVSSHSWADETVYPRVYTLGGVVTPHAGGSQGFLSTWRTRRAQADSRYTFGIGFGSDMNGFSVQGAPRNSPGLDRVTYPFTGFGGVTIQRQHSGTKLYDVNTDGVAHYGLYPDWVEDLRILAEKEKPGDGALILEELARGAEAYLQMWERAIGIAPDACRQDLPDLTDAQFGAASTGMTWSSVLEAVGQPKSRQNAEFRYCLTGDRTGVVSFDSGGVVTSTAIS